MTSCIPQTDDIKTNHGDHLLGSMHVKGQAIRQGAEEVTDNEKQSCNRQLGPQEEQRGFCGIQNPLVAADGA